MGAGNEVCFVSRDRHCFGHLLLDSRVQSAHCQLSFKGHGLRRHCNWRESPSKIEIDSQRHQNGSDYHTKNERFQVVLSFELVRLAQRAAIIIPAMRTFLRFLWMALVLVIVALVSALTAMRFAIHGREVSVPDLQGKSPAEARRIADQEGLAAQVESNYYNKTIPEGRILSQMPPAGTLVRRGWEIRLALSLGPQRVTIPQVAGDSERAATMSITQRGLELSSTAVVQMPNTVSGQVIAQDPPADANDVSAPKMSLLVAAENPTQAFVMPSFIGRPLGSVAASLRDAGFSVGKVTAGSADQTPASTPQTSVSPVPIVAASVSPASIVVAQDPAPGQKILAGAAINFVVK